MIGIESTLYGILGDKVNTNLDRFLIDVLGVSQEDVEANATFDADLDYLGRENDVEYRAKITYDPNYTE